MCSTSCPSVYSRAKRALHEMMYADSRSEGEAASSRFQAEYQAKYPKAVQVAGRQPGASDHFLRLLREHWKHLRTTNLIESPFATERLRQRATGGVGSRTKGFLMAFKLLDMASNAGGTSTALIYGRWFVPGPSLPMECRSSLRNMLLSQPTINQEKPLHHDRPVHNI
jgi:hypothetical protein